MTNIILITNGSRPRLLDQCLRTLYQNTPNDQFNLTLISDGHVFAVELVLRVGMRFQRDCNMSNASVVRIEPPCHIIGRLKNLGAYWSEKQFGRGDWLCFLDDDMALFPGWLREMETAFRYWKVAHSAVVILGGVRHPFHGLAEIGERKNFPYVEVTDAVAGYCHFMRWETWDKYGPYDAHAVGIGQSEDWAICRKIVEDGGKVGYIFPPVMAHCGVTASSGKPAIGSEQIKHEPGYLYE